jgi:hypothetical protein
MIHEVGFFIFIFVVRNHCWFDQFLPLRELRRVWEVKETRKIVSENVLFAFYVMQPRREFFNLVVPSQNTLCFEVIECQIFMVSEDMNVSTKQHTSKFFESSNNGKEILFHGSIVALGLVQFPTEVSKAGLLA